MFSRKLFIALRTGILQWSPEERAVVKKADGKFGFYFIFLLYFFIWLFLGFLLLQWVGELLEGLK